MPKDILVLMTDQHRADWIGAYGADWVRTPTLDKLASEGVMFTKCQTTCPVCMPARTSFLTGMYPHNFGQWTNVGRLQDTHETYLHPLRTKGYRTCHVGKSHLHPHGYERDLREAEPYMHSLGWDDILECTGPLSTQRTKSILTDWMEDNGIYQTFLDDYKKRSETPGPDAWPTPLPDGKHNDDFIANTAVDYISKSDPSQPLYTFVGIGGPHNPFDPPVRFDTYKPEDMPSPIPIDPAPEWLSGPALKHHHLIMGKETDVKPEQWARMRTLYAARIEHVDYLMGQILEAWYAKRGRDTWVMFWSDHGDMLGDKARTCKCVYYKGSVQVPAMLRPPSGLQSGVKSNGLCSTVDLTATLLDIAGCEKISPNMFGSSLRPALADPAWAGSPIAVSEIDSRTMIYDGQWKMVVSKHNELLKLFDTVNDPDETLNLAGKPGTEGEVERLREELLHFLLRTPYRQHREVNG